MYYSSRTMAEVDLKLSQRPSRGADTNRKKLETLRTSTTEFKSSFVPRTIADWNSIPESVAASDSAASFKSRLLTHLRP